MGKVGIEKQKVVEKWEGLYFNCASQLKKDNAIGNISTSSPLIYSVRCTMQMFISVSERQTF